MKAAHMTVRKAGYTFQNGQSALVVTVGGGEIMDWAQWPRGRRPGTQADFDQAVTDWLSWRGVSDPSAGGYRPKSRRGAS